MSSVGQALGGIVGGVIGFMVGGPVGALRGAQLGMMAGGMIDPPDGPVINGPRLDDLNVQTSTYGAFIPRNYGTIAQTGNVFWVQGNALIEVQNTSTSGGKGSPEQTTNTWSYYATFAVGLCEGPIQGLRRIWIGGQLWYDAGSDDILTIVASNQKSELFTLYLGTETQAADPLMQADRGVANVSAHRGLSYIVFDMLPLEKYGNSLMGAQVKVEIVKDGTYSHILSFQGDHATGSRSDDVIVSGNYAYVANSLSDKLLVYNIANPANPYRVGEAATDVYPASLKLSADGNYLYVATTASNTLQVFSVGETPVLVGSVATGLNPFYVAVSGAYAFVTIESASLLSVFDMSDPYNPALAASVATGIYPKFVCIDGDYAYVTSVFHQKLEIFSIVNPLSPALIGTTVLSDFPRDVEVYGDYAYVASDNGHVEVFDISNKAAPSLVNSIHCGTNTLQVDIVGDYLAAINSTGTGGNSLSVINITDPVTAFVVDTIGTTSSQPMSVDVSGNYAWVVNASGTIESYFFADKIITSSTVPLSTIVQTECLTSSLLSAGDVDVTELTDTVRGYRVSQLGAIRGALDPLRAAWPFDVVQHGYQIKFKRRGSASVATIPAGLLDARAAGEEPGIQITDAREMDLMLPRRVDVKYLDSVREYDINEQLSPERTSTDAIGIRKLDLPIVFNGEEAAKTAEILLYLYWLERYDVGLRLPPSYAALEPGDVIDVTSDTADYDLRLTSVNTLPDGRIECAAKYNNATIYVPVARGEEGQSTGGTLTQSGLSVYSLLDIPLMRDDDDTAGFVAAMAGYLSGWPGGVLYRSDDSGQTWTDLRAFSPGAAIGHSLNTIPAHGGTLFDFNSALNVLLYAGSLSSVTEAQLFTGQNWFAYGTHGRWEIIAARTATLQGDGSYILTDFLRGQHGTEWATGLHAVNDRIVLLDANELAFVSVNASTIGAARDYRAITSGAAISSDASQSFTYSGVNLECLSPINLTGSRNPGTNDWTLLWTRRSRYVEWRNYVDAPLGEASESYEVDIYADGTYTTIKRTLTSATQTVNYLSANQVTDFGSNQSTLYVKVYQLSATVGRGYPLTQSISR